MNTTEEIYEFAKKYYRDSGFLRVNSKQTANNFYMFLSDLMQIVRGTIIKSSFEEGVFKETECYGEAFVTPLTFLVESEFGHVTKLSFEIVTIKCGSVMEDVVLHEW
ncbi:MAG: hypothetical protein ACRCZZ_06865 [Phocaeicola sp.]